MTNNNLRKDKEKEFYMQHIETFKAIGIAEPFFTIKTAFFKKGKYGRQVQFFDSELKKGEDIYIEFYENIQDASGKVVNIVPMSEDRQLVKLKYNPYFDEEYDFQETIDNTGKADRKYIVPVNEMVVVLSSGQEISYALYEKRKEEAALEIPQLQKSLGLFPDFETEYSKPTTAAEIELTHKDQLVTEMTIQDFAAILWKKPVSNKQWLNDLIKTS
jgi:hypothetical protein